MSNPETHNPQLPLTLAQYIMDETRKTTDQLGGIELKTYMPDKDISPVEDDLNIAIGELLLAKMADGEHDPVQAIMPDMGDLARPWLRERLQMKAYETYFEALYDQKQLHILELLKGKIITAHARDDNKYALVNTVESVNSPASPIEISGVVQQYDPYTCCLTIGSHPDHPEFTYRVPLWKHDLYSDEIVQVSDIKIE